MTTVVMGGASIEEKRAILDKAGSEFFSVHFIKKDGSYREMTCKKWIEKAFTYGRENAKISTVAHKPEIYTACDIIKGAFRNISLERLVKAKVGGVEYVFE